MQTVSVWILGDQLVTVHPALEAAVAAAGEANVRVVLVESAARRDRMPCHRHKLVLLFSAMRHHADELRGRGFIVDCVEAESMGAGLRAHVARHQSGRLFTMAASEYAGRQWQQEKLAALLGIPVTVVPNTQFLIGRYNPVPNPQPDKRYVLEHFYRAMRRHFNVLMDGNEPVGGAWNFDTENRRPLPKQGVVLPDAPGFAPDATTQAVMATIAALPNGTGTVAGFNQAVTRTQAQEAFKRFVTERLADFGRYEDAMTSRSATIYHSVISPWLNIGLLEPLEVVRTVEAAFHAGQVPINAAEGFVRQVLGWREFMFWQYWRQMPGMRELNSWGANRPIPDFFWTADTGMRCLHHAIRRALNHGYTHHIERLMLLSNFAMLASLNPAAVNDWFLSCFIDAYEWVMLPNVIGMGLNADGGLTATKPYIASANYIDRMSDYCGGCHFNHKQRTGDHACPFNFLYWNFVIEHEERLRANPRTSRSTIGLRHLDADERSRVRSQAAAFLASLRPGDPQADLTAPPE